MEKEQILEALEAVLFANGEPIPIDRICEVFVLKTAEAEKYLEKLAEKYETGSGIKLVRLEDSYQLITKPQFSQYVTHALDLSRKSPLSSAALEVLAIVAYNQPVTKAFVEQIRGVDCAGVMGTLVDKQLIEEKGRLELPGRPLLYGTTKNFLRCFSISSLEELPPLPKDQGIELPEGSQLPLVETEEPEEE